MKMKYVLVLVAVMQIYNAICNETCNMGHIIFYIFIPLAKAFPCHLRAPAAKSAQASKPIRTQYFGNRGMSIFVIGRHLTRMVTILVKTKSVPEKHHFWRETL